MRMSDLVEPSKLASITETVLLSVSAPTEGKVEGQTAVPAAPREELDLSAAITTITSVQKIYSQSKLPPTLSTPFKRWVPELASDAPHDPHAYFPMSLYK